MINASTIFNQLSGILFGNKPTNIVQDNSAFAQLKSLTGENFKRRLRGVVPPNFGRHNQLAGSINYAKLAGRV